MAIPSAVQIAALVGPHVISAAAETATNATESFADVMRNLLADPNDTEAQAAEATTRLSSMAAAEPGTINIEDLRRNAETTLEQFQAQLKQRLAEAGIETSFEFKLVTDGSGSVRLAEDHPYKEEIELALAADEELSATFRYLDGTFSMLRAADEYADFRRRYADDPLSAGYDLINRQQQGQTDQFTLSINGEELEVSFD